MNSRMGNNNFNNFNNFNNMNYNQRVNSINTISSLNTNNIQTPRDLLSISKSYFYYNNKNNLVTR